MKTQTTMLVAATALSLGVGVTGPQSALAKDTKDHRVQVLMHGGFYAQATTRNTSRAPARATTVGYPGRSGSDDACDLPSTGCSNDKRIVN